MKVYEKLKILSLVLSFLTCLSACSKKTENPSSAQTAVDYTDNLFGMSFEHVSITAGTDLEKKIAQAVVYIDTGDMSSGTGTFISADGRVLTNEHVVPRGTCAANEICKNVRVIRGMFPGGPIEVFNQVRVVAHRSENADAAILQVETNGKKVPFVPLATDEEVMKFKESQGQNGVLIVGHPFGGTTRVSRSEVSEFDYDYDGQIRLNTTAISGNSGSAIVDKVTGKIVGLYDSSNWDKETVELVSGKTRRYGSGADLALVRVTLGMKDLAKDKPSPKANPLTHEEIIAEPIFSRFTNRSALPTLAIQYARVARTPFERLRVIGKLLGYLDGITQPERSVATFLSSVIGVYRYEGKRPEANKGEIPMALTHLAPKVFSDDSSRKWRLQTILGDKDDQSACLNKYKDSKFNKPMGNCFSKHNSDGEPVVSKFGVALLEYLRDPNSTLTLDDVSTYRFNILWILMHGRPTQNDLGTLVQVAKLMMTKTSNASEIYQLETLILVMEEKPTLFQTWEATQ